MAIKKAGTRKAIQFFEDNYIMIASLEAKGEEGCTEKILNILKNHVATSMPKEAKRNDDSDN